MSYVVSDGVRDWPVRVEPSDDGSSVVVVGERSFKVDAARSGPSAFSFIVDGRAWDAVVTRRDGFHHVRVGGRSYVLEVLDERQRLLRDQRAAQAAEGPAEISASMPGRVVEVLVAEGDEVEEGQGIVVLEAMKMENELKAPKAGCVAKVCVAQGEATEAGQTLVVIE